MLDRVKRFCLFNPCFLLATAVAGLIGSCYQVSPPQVELVGDRVTEVEGWISRPPQVLEDHIYLELSPLSIKQQEVSISYPGRLAIYISSSVWEPENYFDPPLAYGEVLGLISFLEEPPYYAIPGVTDFRKAYWTQGIYHRVRLKSPLQVERKGHYPIARLLRPLFTYGEKFRRFCQKYFQTDQLKLVLSVFLGDRKTLEETDKDLIRKLGIYHLFVVSGFHVSIIVLFLHWPFRHWALVGRMVTLAGLWIYVILVGAGLPTIRAGIMTSLFYLLLCFGRARQFLNALGISALVVFAVSPQALFSAGFQFSYLCLSVIGLFVLPHEHQIRSLTRAFKDAFTERISVRRDPAAKYGRRMRFFLEEKLYFGPRRGCLFLLPSLGSLSGYFLSLTLCGWFIHLLTLPLSLYYTNRWIWTQGIFNLILVPLFTLFIPGCLVLFLTFWLPTGPVLAHLVSAYAGLLSRLMTGLEEWTWLTYVRQPGFFETAIYFLLFLSAYYFLPGKTKFVAFLSPLWLWLALQQPAFHAPEKLFITMLDVGQGESLHLRYPDGTDALMDVGGFLYSPEKISHFVGERLISRYLWEEKSRELDYVLLTHPHADHIQGFDFIHQVFPIGHLFFHDFPDTEPDLPRQRLYAGDGFSIAGVEHLVLHPPRQRASGSHWNTNNASLVVQLKYRDFKMLFTGDIENEAEQYLLPALHPVTVLKAAHHGARSSNSRELLERTQPKLAIISAGRKNVFGHPSPATLKRFGDAGVATLDTPQWGSIRIETDGFTWQVFHYSMEHEAFREIHLQELTPVN